MSNTEAPPFSSFALTSSLICFWSGLFVSELLWFDQVLILLFEIIFHLCMFRSSQSSLNHGFPLQQLRKQAMHNSNSLQLLRLLDVNRRTDISM